MKSFPKIAIFAFGICFVGLRFLPVDWLDVTKLYSKLQPSLFTGFLTLGGFLLSLMVFILVQLKKELFDSPEYKAHFAEVQKVQKTDSLYAPLKNLGGYLLYSVLFSLLTSISQVTVGLVDNRYAAIFCFSIALSTLCVVLRAWLAIRKTLNGWFSHLQ